MESVKKHVTFNLPESEPVQKQLLEKPKVKETVSIRRPNVPSFKVQSGNPDF